MQLNKTLIKYNSYRLEENDEEENESINIELTRKTDPYNDKNGLNDQI